MARAPHIATGSERTTTVTNGYSTVICARFFIVFSLFFVACIPTLDASYIRSGMACSVLASQALHEYILTDIPECMLKLHKGKDKAQAKQMELQRRRTKKDDITRNPTAIS